MPKNLARGNALYNVVFATQIAICGFAAPAAVAADGAQKPHIDLAFCIDTTGSMQSEIDNVKAKTKEIVAKLSGGTPVPVVRVGLVAFRDRGDTYITKVFPFTGNIDKVVQDISSLQADGGGDGPESVNEALHVAVNDLKWDESNKTLKMLFLIGDAGPHAYPNDYDWRTESKRAIGKGIQINTLACQGLEGYSESEGVGVFKEIAKLSDGRFESLSYRSEIADAHGHKTAVVASGGRVYRMKSGAADWRGGADSLVSKGAATLMDSSAVSAGAPMAMGFAAARALGGAGGGYAAAEVSRKDNNLADVVLKATREEAKKKLNVDYK